MSEAPRVTIIGGGLAGCEAAWQVASRGIDVTLFEMRPHQMTPAHESGDLAELVCSNSLGADRPERAPGLLKRELEALGSLILSCARETAVPAGGALAVGREAFSARVTQAIASHPRIRVRREQVERVPDEGYVIVASGPLTSAALAQHLAELAGQEQLYFYDAMAPIVALESINMERVFRASRYERGEADYINCPMTREEYDAFWQALVAAPRIALRDFEREDQRFFEACLPVEVLASRGQNTLAFGPLKPVGLRDPRTGQRPYALVQLRQDNLAGTLYNLVGFQTNLTWGAQKDVFGLIPGLEHAEWVRFGQMHRNTFVNAPQLLTAGMRWRPRPDLFLAGQITGTEGYVGSTASGLVAGLNVARAVMGQPELIFPLTTILGSLLHYVSASTEQPFQPMKPNFGILQPLERHIRHKLDRCAALAARSAQAMADFVSEHGLQSVALPSGEIGEPCVTH